MCTSSSCWPRDCVAKARSAGQDKGVSPSCLLLLAARAWFVPLLWRQFGSSLISSLHLLGPLDSGPKESCNTKNSLSSSSSFSDLTEAVFPHWRKSEFLRTTIEVSRNSLFHGLSAKLDGGNQLADIIDGAFTVLLGTALSKPPWVKMVCIYVHSTSVCSSALNLFDIGISLILTIGLTGSTAANNKALSSVQVG